VWVVSFKVGYILKFGVGSKILLEEIGSGRHQLA
jgi:hypothetical protein